MHDLNWKSWREATVCLAVLGVLALGGPWAAGAGEMSLPGVALGDAHSVGGPIRVDNLVIFPIYASVHEDVGAFETLDEALKAGRAVVREVGTEPTPAPPQPSMGRRVLQRAVGVRNDNVAVDQDEVIQEQVQFGGGATVGTLVIENTGHKAILVLAGTVVKGGNQDRQVGQDFVVGPKQVVPVDAFCVEHGRWSGAREGEATGGQFGTVGVLASQRVRVAGQYKGDQSAVWENVALDNADNAKGTETGTLMATLDDPEVKAKRDALVSQITAALDALPEHTRVAGLAYAVDGDVTGARWFVNHDMYLKFRPMLLGTMSVEAVTAQNATKAQGKPMIIRTVPQKAVGTFIEDLKNSKVQKETATKAMNHNAYRENEGGFSSECVVERKGRKIQFSMDFLAR
ncbi:MAG: DUF6569 family protein [Pseudomonadota bacterium]